MVYSHAPGVLWVVRAVLEHPSQTHRINVLMYGVFACNHLKNQLDVLQGDIPVPWILGESGKHFQPVRCWEG